MVCALAATTLAASGLALASPAAAAQPAAEQAPAPAGEPTQSSSTVTGNPAEPAEASAAAAEPSAEGWAGDSAERSAGDSGEGSAGASGEGSSDGSPDGSDASGGSSPESATAEPATEDSTEASTEASPEPATAEPATEDSTEASPEASPEPATPEPSTGDATEPSTDPAVPSSISTPAASGEPSPEPAPPSPTPPAAASLTASAVGASDPAATTAAAAWLAGRLSEAGTVVGSFPGDDGTPVEFTDWGRTLDAALALLAAGGHDDVLGRALASVEDPAAVAEYTQGAGSGDRADAAYVGATAKLALVVELTGGDAEDAGRVDLLAQLLSLAQADGTFADRSDFGSFANLYGHAFGLLALDAADRTPDPALVDGLLAAQCPDGGFPETYDPAEGASCTGQLDATGLVLQTLAALDLAASDEAQRAISWVTGQQQADGSFPGEAPVNSTGYVVLGLNAVGQPNQAAVQWLVTQQNDDGGLARGAGDDTTSDLFATAQALPALAGTTFVDSARAVARVELPGGTPTTPPPGEGGTPSPSPQPPAPEPPPVTEQPPATQPPAAVGRVPRPRQPRPVAERNRARNRAEARARAGGRARAAGRLPRTGADVADLLLLGTALVGTGTALTLAGTRRRRPA